MTQPKQNMQNTRELMTWYAEGKLSPHIDKIFPLEEAPKAIETLLHRKVKGKVVVQMT